MACQSVVLPPTDPVDIDDLLDQIDQVGPVDSVDPVDLVDPVDPVDPTITDDSITVDPPVIVNNEEPVMCCMAMAYDCLKCKG